MMMQNDWDQSNLITIRWSSHKCEVKVVQVNDSPAVMIRSMVQSLRALSDGDSLLNINPNLCKDTSITLWRSSLQFAFFIIVMETSDIFTDFLWCKTQRFLCLHWRLASHIHTTFGTAASFTRPSISKPTIHQLDFSALRVGSIGLNEAFVSVSRFFFFF